jgi:hypothetical protein
MIIALWISYIVLVPDSTTSWILQLVEMPLYYKLRLYVIGVLYILLTYLFERYFVVGMFRGVLNVFSLRKLKYYYAKYIKRGSDPYVHKSKKVYNLLRDGVKTMREEELTRRTDSVTLVVDQI